MLRCDGTMPGMGGREGASPVPAIAELPTVVLDAVRKYGDLFLNAPQRRHIPDAGYFPAGPDLP